MRSSHHRNAFAPLAIAALGTLAGCGHLPGGADHTGPATVRMPLQTAWFEGLAVRYITTDVSDAEIARAKGANFVPRLQELLPAAGSPGQRLGTALERVYAFVDSPQPTVFPSVPRPVGAASVDASYSPLWRMVKVAWQPGRTVTELKSEEAVLRAEERGDVRLTITNVVLNCSVLAVEGGPPLPGVSLTAR